MTREKEHVEILWISDLHLGSKDCNARGILRLLKKYHFKKLVAVGDLSEGKPIGKLQIKIVEKLKKIHQQGKLVVTYGNHDPKGNGVCREIGIQAVEDYTCLVAGKSIFATHGDKFNDLGDNLNDHVIDWIICKLMVLLKLIKLRGINLGIIIIKLCAQLNALEVTRKAKEFASKKYYDKIICGHVHVPCHRIFMVKKRRIDYFNCGSFFDGESTYVVTHENGHTYLRSL